MTFENPQMETRKFKGVADLIFCFDSSGSMAFCLDKLKSKALAFIESLKDDNGSITVDWRVKVMGFRDFNCDSEKIINNSFTTNPKEFKNQLSHLIPDGGGDEPKSAFDAMWYAVKETEWRPKCHKVLIMFTDSTPHPVHQDTIDKFTITEDQEFLINMMYFDKIKLFLFCKDCEPFEDMQALARSYIKLYSDPQEGFNEIDDDTFECIYKTITRRVAEPIIY